LCVEPIESQLIDDMCAEQSEDDNVTDNVPVVPEPWAMNMPLLQLNEAVSLLPLHYLLIVIIVS
jgi:hypothetical protein